MDEEFLREIDQARELLSGQKDLEKLENETIICECFCVNVGDIRAACAEKQTVDLRQLEAKFSLGLGCRTCVKKTDYWINKIF